MKSTRHHIESLDVFRGLTIASMILVNNPGDWRAVYTPLLHVAWDGCSFADVVFPAFIFIVGVATSFAFTRRRNEGHGRGAIVWRIVRRTLLLIALGIVLNISAPPSETGALRFPGVLQRIGIVYAITAMFVMWTGVRGRLIAITALLLGHTICLLAIPFGGQHAGMLDPGVNFSNHIDNLVFGRHVMSLAADPEGLFGTVTATANALLGSLAGRWLRSSPDPWRRVGGLGAGALVLLAAGYAWSYVIPLNKNLWTASYALFTSGIAAGALVVCYLLVDVLKVRQWARPFVWLGLNPLAIYFLSELVGHFRDRPIIIHGETWTPQSWLFWTKLEPVLGTIFDDPAASSLVVGLLYVSIWVVLAWWLYKKQIRIVV